MDAHQIKQHLTDLVLDGREDVALEELVSMSNSSGHEVQKKVAALSTRFQRFEQEKTSGQLSKENVHAASNKISQALMVLIEQVTEDLDDDRHLRNLDVLLQDIDDVSAGSQPEVVAPPKKTIRRLMIAVPAVVAIVLGILAFNGTFSKSSNPGVAALSNWHGNWKHQMQAAGDASVTGILAFVMEDDDETVGRSHSIFPDGSETNITLSGIVFSGDGNVMEGSWRTDNVQSLHGRFRFDLEEKDRFEGYYTVDNQEGKYYWRGTK